MKISVFLMGISLFCLPAKKTEQGPLYNNMTGNWKIIKETGNVILSERWIILKNGANSREIKGEMELMSTVTEAVELITDITRTKQWMSGVSDVHLIKRSEAGSWYTYTLFNIPWPFNKREMVSHVSLSKDLQSNNASIEVVSIDDLIPTNENIIRLKNYRAVWTIERMAENKIKISFTALSAEPPAFPRWIQDPLLNNVFIDNLLNLSKLLEA